MNIKVNGKAQECADSTSVQALAEQLGLNLRQVAIERNGEIVPKSIYGKTMLGEGDAIEIVRFIGGG